MQKHREVQSKKEMEKERQSTRSALEITLEKRARRLEEVMENSCHKYFIQLFNTLRSYRMI